MKFGFVMLVLMAILVAWVLTDQHNTRYSTVEPVEMPISEAMLRTTCITLAVECSVKQEASEWSAYAVRRNANREGDWWFAYSATREGAMGKLNQLLAGPPTDPGYASAKRIN